MALIVLEVLWRFYTVHKQAKADAQQINNLVSEYKKLEVEKQEFEALSTTDVLTGVMNRAGVQQFLQRLFESDFSRNQMGVLLFDIDHFKKVNDQLGHDVGDLVLSKVANIINSNIRHTDILAAGAERNLFSSHHKSMKSACAHWRTNCAKPYPNTPSISKDNPLP